MMLRALLIGAVGNATPVPPKCNITLLPDMLISPDDVACNLIEHCFLAGQNSSECCTICKTTPGCTAFSADDNGCYLKSEPNTTWIKQNLVECPGSTSGGYLYDCTCSIHTF